MSPYQSKHDSPFYISTAPKNTKLFYLFFVEVNDYFFFLKYTTCLVSLFHLN